MDQLVRLELVAAADVDAATVVTLVQDLRGIPEDATCEIEELSCRALPAKEQQGYSMRMTRTLVQLRCEPHVAAFLCQKFGYELLSQVAEST